MDDTSVEAHDEGPEPEPAPPDTTHLDVAEDPPQIAAEDQPIVVSGELRAELDQAAVGQEQDTPRSSSDLCAVCNGVKHGTDSARRREDLGLDICNCDDQQIFEFPEDQAIVELPAETPLEIMQKVVDECPECEWCQNSVRQPCPRLQ